MRTVQMLFFATLVLSCKPVKPQNVESLAIGAPLLDRVVKLCGVTVYQEHPGRGVNVISANDVNSVVTVSSNGYSAVMYLSPGAKDTIDAHLVHGKNATIKVELVEIDGSHDGMEKCRPEIVIVQ
jgi:hypothetical protein